MQDHIQIYQERRVHQQIIVQQRNWIIVVERLNEFAFLSPAANPRLLRDAVESAEDAISKEEHCKIVGREEIRGYIEINEVGSVASPDDEVHV